MYICDKEIQQIKKEILKYYQNQKAVEGQKKHLERLYIRLNSIQEDIDSPQLNHCLKTDIRGIAYDSIIASGGTLPSSGMDREIERIYNALEQDYRNTQNEILLTKALIRKLEQENSDMDFYMTMLAGECRLLLDRKYREGKSLYQIAASLDMSEATVSRTLKDIYTGLAGLKSYYKKT